MTHIVVCGPRKLNEYSQVTRILDSVIARHGHENVTIVSGHATGTDLLGERYAAEHGLELEIYSADWSRYGRAAGPIRNREMATVADLVVAFVYKDSRGTRSMIREADKRYVPVFTVPAQIEENPK